MKVTKIPFWPAMPTDNKDTYTPRLKLTPLQGKMMISALALLLLTLGTATGLALTGQSQDLYSSASCDAGQLDITNACNPACCNADNQCPDGQSCSFINGYCQSGTSCDPYSGTDPVTPPPLDCPPGKVNKNNQCDPACCDSNSQCTIAGETCSISNGHCNSGTSCGQGTTSSGSSSGDSGQSRTPGDTTPIGGVPPIPPSAPSRTTPDTPPADTTAPTSGSQTPASTACDPYNSSLPQNQTTPGGPCCGSGTYECSPDGYQQNGVSYYLFCNAAYGEIGTCEARSYSSSPATTTPTDTTPSQPAGIPQSPCPGGAIRATRSETNGAVDFTCPGGTVYATCTGTVTAIETVSTTGQRITIQCNDGTIRSFLHFGQVNVSLGQSISPGTDLGQIDPNISDHTHMETEKDGSKVDTIDFVPVPNPDGDNRCEQVGGTCTTTQTGDILNCPPGNLDCKETVANCPNGKFTDTQNNNSCQATSKGNICCIPYDYTASDYGALFKFWGQVVNALNAHADFNEDGKIGPLDYVILFDNWTL